MIIKIIKVIIKDINYLYVLVIAVLTRKLHANIIVSTRLKTICKYCDENKK